MHGHVYTILYKNTQDRLIPKFSPSILKFNLFLSREKLLSYIYTYTRREGGGTRDKATQCSIHTLFGVLLASAKKSSRDMRLSGLLSASILGEAT